MKNIYLFLCLLLLIYSANGQKKRFSDLAPGKTNGLKNAQVLPIPEKSEALCKIDALILYSDYDVPTTLQNGLMATGKFNSVDVLSFFNNTTLDVTDIQDYDAVLVFMNTQTNVMYAKDAIQNYLELGGGVVTCDATNIRNWDLGLDSDYNVVGTASTYSFNTLSLGTVHDDTHPVLEGISTLSFYTAYYINAPLNPASELIAEWNNGENLVSVRENIGTSNARSVDLNFFPYPTFMDDPNAFVLATNALVWSSRKCECADIVVENDPGLCEAVVNYNIFNQSSVAVKQFDSSGLTSGDAFPVGETLQQYEIDYGGGVLDTCSFTVTVEDKEAPVLVCNPLKVNLRANGQYVLTKKNIDSIVDFSDNCTATEDIIIEVFPRSFDCVHIGQDVNVKITAIDASGNSTSCQTTVTVYDKTAPVAQCKDITVALDEDGEVRLLPFEVENQSTDECGIDIIALDKAVFSCSDLGENTVELSVSDKGGNVSTCNAVVTVIDTIAPVFAVVEDVQIELEPGVCETAIDYPNVMVIENCEFELVQTAGIGPDGMFPLGVTTETWIAMDSSGNSSEVSFEVIITTTNAAPTIDSISGIEVYEDASPVNVSLGGISGGNDCEVQDVTVSASASNSSLITGITADYTEGSPDGSLTLTIAPETSGEADVTVAVEDSEGAIMSRTFTVTVLPVNDAPFVVQRIPDQTLHASYKLSVPVSAANGVLFDDIDDENLTLSVALENEEELPEWITLTEDSIIFEPMIADTGCISVVVTATDLEGATATNAFSVCVEGYPVFANDLIQTDFEVKMYPNPTRGLVDIHVSKTINAPVELSVADITGKMIMRRHYSGSEDIQFDMSGKVPGLYFMHLTMGDKKVVKKLVLNY